MFIDELGRHDMKELDISRTVIIVHIVAKIDKGCKLDKASGSALAAALSKMVKLEVLDIGSLYNKHISN